jgi:cell division protein FtsQ
MRRYNWKKILINTAWILAGAGTMVLLGAAMQKKNHRPCTGVHIEITGAEKHMFIDEKDVMDLLNAGGRLEGNASSVLDLRVMETSVEKNPWVRNAEMFLDNQQMLQVRIEERQPVARVFTLEGGSFYLDSAALRLPLSDKISARVPVFTSFPSDKPVLAKPDSMLLHDVVRLGQFLLADSFWMAQTAQVDITPQSGFEIVPVIGDHTIVLGNAENIDQKFSRLYTFYQKAWLQHGITTYEKLDVQYNNQVVAIRKGTAKARVDSARIHAIMNGMMPDQSVPDSSSPSHSVKTTTPVKPATDTVATAKKITATGTPSAKTMISKKTLPHSGNKTTTKPLSNEKKSRTTEKKQAKAVMSKTGP